MAASPEAPFSEPPSPLSTPGQNSSATVRDPSKGACNLPPWLEITASLGAGLCMAAPSYRASLAVLTYGGLLALFTLVGTAPDERTALRRGLWASMAANGLVFHFLIYTMQTYGSLPLAAALVMFALYLLVFCTRIPLLAWGCWHLHHRVGLPLWQAAGLATVAAETLQFALFPLHLGSTQQQDLLMMQTVDLLGVGGLSALLAVVGGLLAQSLLRMVGREASSLRPEEAARSPWRPLGGAASLLLASHIYGWLRYQQIEDLSAQGPALRVAVVQPNTPLRFYRDDFSTARRVLQTCSSLSRRAAQEAQAPLDLIVWPEGATPFSFENKFNIYERLFCPPPAGSGASVGQAPSPQIRAAQATVRAIDGLFHQTIVGLARELHTSLLFNEAYYEEADPYNNVRLVNADGRTLDSYQKMKLLAFGEYVPFDKTLTFLEGFGGVHDHKIGTRLHNLETPHGPLAPQICYEILYSEGARALVAQGAHAILNLTNDAWFGPTHASPAHLLEAYPRALEVRRPLVRATNSGTSTVIAASGRFVTPPSGLFVETCQTAEVRDPGVTTLYLRVGDLPLWLCTFWALGLGLGLVGPRRRRFKQA